MVGKERLKKRLKQISALKNWQLFILLVLVIFVDLTALRLNNVGMIRRRDAVRIADESGNEEATRQATVELAEYVRNHMNSGGMAYDDQTHWYKINSEVKVIWAKIYERDVKKIEAEVSAAAESNPNGNIFKKAEEACRPRFSGYSVAYQQCILDEQNKYPTSESLQTKISYPDVSKYTFSFVAPLWSPDLAGWTTLVAIVIIFMIIFKMITTVILKAMLKKYSPKV